MKNVSLNDLQALKRQRQPFSCLTAYDATIARLISTQGVEVILVGDSLGMVIQGHDSTLPVRLRDMVYHTRCVSRGNRGSFLVADMPFAQHYSSAKAIESAIPLMRAGAQCIKIEGGEWLGETVTQLKRCGIPVCAHLGLCPQSVHVYGGYKKQGTDQSTAETIHRDAIALAVAGAALLLLESVPAELTLKITAELSIPVIGIGAGHADGQVLVIQDVLGMTDNPPSFAKNFMHGHASVQEAIVAYHEAVKSGKFPGNS